VTRGTKIIELCCGGARRLVPLPGRAQGRPFVACEARRPRRSAALDERAVSALWQISTRESEACRLGLKDSPAAFRGAGRGIVRLGVAQPSCAVIADPRADKDAWRGRRNGWCCRLKPAEQPLAIPVDNALVRAWRWTRSTVIQLAERLHLIQKS
jgi:hypothetical protein